MTGSGFESGLFVLLGSALTYIFSALAEERRRNFDTGLEDKRAKRDDLQWKRQLKYASYKDFCTYAQRWNNLNPSESSDILSSLRDKVSDIHLLANSKKLRTTCSGFMDSIDQMKRIEKKLIPMLEKKDKSAKAHFSEWEAEYAKALRQSKTVIELLRNDISEY